MFGGGSIQGMITSLSNNRKLLRSKKLFKKERSFLNLKKEYLKASEGEKNQKKSSKEELHRVRKKIIKERRRENVLLITVGIILLSAFTYFIIHIIEQENIAIKKQQTLEFKKKEKEFLSLIDDGDEWFEKGKWHNSIYYYKKAKDIFPKNYDVNYRLVRSYSFECENEFENCEKAKKLLDKLFQMYPDRKKELLKIKGILGYES